ncbi:MAG: flagellar export protein FliJ [candidate division Zixibacteria bacterium]|nr:flagellar export protein FliJ [candidate division Zixibacteria bacterium]
MARKFEFPLEKLLKIRKFKTRAAQRELGKSMSKLHNRIDDLELLLNEASSGRGNLSKLISSVNVDMKSVGIVVEYLDQKRDEIKICKRDIVEFEKEVDKKRILLNEAVKEEEKFNKYKERLFEKHKKSENKRLMKVIDEAASRMIFYDEGEKVLVVGK